jgi:hypothetical protein
MAAKVTVLYLVARHCEVVLRINLLLAKCLPVSFHDLTGIVFATVVNEFM